MKLPNVDPFSILHDPVLNTTSRDPCLTRPLRRQHVHRKIYSYPVHYTVQVRPWDTFLFSRALFRKLNIYYYRVCSINKLLLKYLNDMILA